MQEFAPGGTGTTCSTVKFTFFLLYLGLRAGSEAPCWCKFPPAHPQGHQPLPQRGAHTHNPWFPHFSLRDTAGLNKPQPWASAIAFVMHYKGNSSKEKRQSLTWPGATAPPAAKGSHPLSRNPRRPTIFPWLVLEKGQKAKEWETQMELEGNNQFEG